MNFLSNLFRKIHGIEGKTIKKFIHAFDKDEDHFLFSEVIFNDNSMIISDSFGNPAIGINNKIDDYDDIYFVDSRLPVVGKEIESAYLIVSWNRGEWGMVYFKFKDNTSIHYHSWGDYLHDFIENDDFDDDEEIYFIDLVLGVSSSNIVSQTLFDTYIDIELIDETEIRVHYSNNLNKIKSINYIYKGEVLKSIEENLDSRKIFKWISLQL